METIKSVICNTKEPEGWNPPWLIPIKKLVLTPSAGEWCRLPYPGHPKGCPNYGETDRCPPLAPHVTEVFDLEKPLYFVHSEFDLEAHAARMKEKHPNWSERQCRCVLYWQGTSRKQMKERVELARWNLRTTNDTACPEGLGVNVFATARLAGLDLERTRQIKTCRHVSMLGHALGR